MSVHTRTHFESRYLKWLDTRVGIIGIKSFVGGSPREESSYKSLSRTTPSFERLRNE